MKNLFLLLGGFILLCSQTPDKTLLKGHIDGLDAKDSVLVFSKAGKDTVAAPNGDFVYEFKGSEPSIVRVYNYPKTLPNGKKEALRMHPVTLLMFPGQSVDMSGNFDTYRLHGSDFYEEYNKLMDSMSDVDSVRLAINDEYMKLLWAKAPKDQIRAKFNELKNADLKVHERIEKYVNAHLDSELSLYMLYTYRPRFGEKSLPQLAESVKNGHLKALYTELTEHYERMAARRAASERIKDGKMAPDFTLKDLSGKDFTLSSLRGKYVVLDFWGSWCGWCVKGFPDMKKMYEKYKNRLEIVGVDCRDTEDRWKAAVEKHGLKWTNVINSTDKDKDLTTIFNVPGFPTKVIISPEGKIVKIIVGEKPEFYQTIDKLLNM